MAQRTAPWIRLAALAVLLAGAAWLLAAVGGVVQLVLVAALVAYLLDPLVTRLEARGLGRTSATTVVFVGASVVLGLLVVLAYPVAAGQVEAIRAGFDAAQAQAALDRLERVLEARLAVLGVGDLDLLDAGHQFINEHAGDLVNAVPGVLTLAGQLLVIPFLAFFLLRDRRRIKKGFISLMPNRYFEFSLNVLHKTDQQLGNYLRGQLLASLVVALLSILALWLLDVDFFILIGLFAGLTNLIPYLGPIAGATVAALVSVLTTGSFDTVLPIIVAFALIQTIDNVGVQPLVLARNVALHPVTVLLALLVGGTLFGAMGLLLGVPATAVLKIIVQETLTNLRSYHLA